jgi:hypothetical protein
MAERMATASALARVTGAFPGGVRRRHARLRRADSGAVGQFTRREL